MAREITRAEAWDLLREYNQEPFHLQHGETVEAVMGYFAAGRAVIFGNTKAITSRRSETPPASIYPDRARSAASRRNYRQSRQDT